MDASTGLTASLALAAFLLGLRHGIDWDHIIAITDIAATTETRRRGAWLGTLYVLGHASVVIALGVVAILIGASVPEGADAAMGRIVGITLIALGLLVVYTMIVERKDFRPRSRWLLLFSAVRRASRAARRLLRIKGRVIVHTHEHASFESSHHGDADRSPTDDATHTHEHTHPADELVEYSNATSIGIGMLHGVGAETPTQVVIFLAAAGAGGVWAGIGVLLVFVFGLMISNSLITLASALGFAAAARRRNVQFALGAFAAIMSIGVGVLFLLGEDAALPAFFAG